VPENDNETSSEPRSRKFNASYTRRGDDVPGDANHEQIAEALIKDDLGRHTRVGATEHDGEGLLTPDEFVTPSEPQGRVCRSIRREATVAFAESLQCINCGEHGVIWAAP
jgi:hypothetical protein